MYRKTSKRGAEEEGEKVWGMGYGYAVRQVCRCV